MKTLLILTTLSLLSLFGYAQKIETIYLKNGCNSCHGMYAEGMGTYPKLQGVSKEKLFRRLKDLQNGKTRTAFGDVMISFAKSLDDNETLEMAKYLSNLKTTIPKDRYYIEYDRSGDGGS